MSVSFSIKKSVASRLIHMNFAQQDTRKRELPGDLRRLLPYHKGKDYRVVGNDIVLIEIATELILDVMKDVLR